MVFRGFAGRELLYHRPDSCRRLSSTTGSRGERRERGEQQPLVTDLDEVIHTHTESRVLSGENPREQRSVDVCAADNGGPRTAIWPRTIS